MTDKKIMTELTWFSSVI